jgi:hypothetical protein
MRQQTSIEKNGFNWLGVVLFLPSMKWQKRSRIGKTRFFNTLKHLTRMDEQKAPTTKLRTSNDELMGIEILIDLEHVYFWSVQEKLIKNRCPSLSFFITLIIIVGGKEAVKEST